MAAFDFEISGDCTDSAADRPAARLILRKWSRDDENHPISLSQNCIHEQEIDESVEHLIETLHRVAVRAKAELKKRQNSQSTSIG